MGIKIYIALDEKQDIVYYGFIMKKPILEILRKEVDKSPESREKICKETGIDRAAMSRIMHGGHCKDTTIDKLLNYFSYKIVKTKKRGK
jgi:predicted XRE-type DNA-binding protein